MKNQPEYQLHKQICDYIRRQYPRTLFLSDLDNQIRLTIGQAKRNKALQKEGFSCPDLIIFEPNGNSHGLFLEIKASSIYKKDGVSLLKNEHVEKQADSIRQLQERGFTAHFIWDFDKAKAVIDEHLRSF